jgi:hypothetical protein
MSKPTPINKPTRTSINALLSELVRTYAERWWESACKVTEEADALEKKLTDVPELKRLRKQAKALRAEHREQSKIMTQKVLKVRRLFQANGLTPAVQRAIDELVEEANKDASP